jgi:squalene-hopene/tetraprenyl-beta-curcumene cyclase
MAAGEIHSSSVQRGVRYLLSIQDSQGGSDEKAFTGTGFPTVFYLRYHGYGHYFPLWALGVYRRLRTGKGSVQDKISLESPVDLSLPALK